MIATRLAVPGLVLVLLALAGFATTAVVMSSRAVGTAERSGVVSGLSEAAEQALLEQEDAAEDVVAAPDDEQARAGYAEADAATRQALEALRSVQRPGDRGGVQQALAQHRSYGETVEGMFAVAEDGEEVAAAYEEDVVDPEYDAVAQLVEDEVERCRVEARQALADLARLQRLLLSATPLVVGVGLALVAVFGVALGRHRRRIVQQASENQHQALHDALTGLPNRTLLRERAEGAVADAARGGHHAALLFIDLDRFKEINDTLGHHCGDAVLVAVGDRLRRTVRDGDVVARLGGDEFAVLLPSVTDVEGATALAGTVLRALQEGLDVDGVWLDVDASIGVVVSGYHGGDVATLLQHADIAMYVAKGRGGGVCAYAEDLNGHSLERLGLVGELRRALDQGELVLHYQPKVSMTTSQVCGVEALVRWQHPQRGLVPPDEFIPVAERTGLIRPLTRYVVDAALAQCRSWQDQGRTLQVAVNVSARNLLDERFVDDVLAARAAWGVPASCLELEVTESAIMADPLRAELTITRLAQEGFSVSIDDFGAGYTSLAHLKHLPVHQLKIDRSFVGSMQVDRSDALIVRSVVELGRNLGLTTVAEGVEDEATWDQLAALGCDVGQGYYLSRPLPAEQLDAWFTSLTDHALPAGHAAERLTTTAPSAVP